VRGKRRQTCERSKKQGPAALAVMGLFEPSAVGALGTIVSWAYASAIHPNNTFDLPHES